MLLSHGRGRGAIPGNEEAVIARFRWFSNGRVYFFPVTMLHSRITGS